MVCLSLCSFGELLTVFTGQKSEATEGKRKKIRDSCEQSILDFFGDEERGQVAIYDANNGTKASRKTIGDKFEKEGVHVIFLGACFAPFAGHFLIVTGFRVNMYQSRDRAGECA